MNIRIATATVIFCCLTSLNLGFAQSLPNCVSADSDVDGDGFGFENSESCIVVVGVPATGDVTITSTGSAASLRNDEFGAGVSVDGERVAVTVSRNRSSHNGGVDIIGDGVDIYELRNGAWFKTAEVGIPGSTIAEQDGVKLVGDSFIASYPYDRPAFVAVYNLINDTWTQTATLVASDLASIDIQPGFGVTAVAFDGSRAIVGAPRHNYNGVQSGAAYIFALQDGLWVEEAILTASDGERFDKFGESVVLDGERVIVGAPFSKPDDFTNAGSAYVFEFKDGRWTETAKLVASDHSNEPTTSFFGVSVDFDDDQAIIGASYATGTGGFTTGAAYVFNLSDSTWVETAKLMRREPITHGRFGSSVLLEGDRAFVGDPAYISYSGAVYVFNLINGLWVEADDTLSAGVSSATHQNFGRDISVSHDRLIVGAPGEVNENGAVHIFTVGGADDGCDYSNADVYGGWGWNEATGESCAPIAVNSGNVVDMQSSDCIDSDGDGWGWNGVSSCLVSSDNSANSNNLNDSNQRCVDTDGDGWGWNSTTMTSCRM